MKRNNPAWILLLFCSMPVFGEPAYLNKIDSDAAFDALSTTSYRTDASGLKEVMFVIDATENRVFYINSRLYKYHMDFMSSQYLTSMKANTLIATDLSVPEGRRFTLGFLVRTREPARYVVEFWRDTFFSGNLIKTIMERIDGTLFTRDALFRPASEPQDTVARKTLGEKGLYQENAPLYGAYEALNTAEAVGKLRIIDEVRENTVCDPDEILITRKSMRYMFCVTAGAISAVPVTALSHYVLIMHGLGIPAASIIHADEKFRGLAGKEVYFAVRPDGYTLRPATSDEAARLARSTAAQSVELPSDLNYRELAPLSAQRAEDFVRFGSKSANLGEMFNSGIAGLKIPGGFSIPFYFYGQFIRENALGRDVQSVASDARMRADGAYRRARLAELRSKIEAGTVNPELARAIAEKLEKEFKGLGVFARSSTNSEDLPKFTGAGLYTTVPNAVGLDSVLKAVKKVWASIWNERAYEARDRFGIKHGSVMAGVILQRAMDAESAGVAVVNRTEGDGIEVRLAAKKGLGIRVTDGNEPAENWVYRAATDKAENLGPSEDRTTLKLAPSGGVRSERADGRFVLTEGLAGRIGRIALEISRHFDAPQDIEWLVIGDDIYIVQARPYL